MMMAQKGGGAMAAAAKAMRLWGLTGKVREMGGVGGEVIECGRGDKKTKKGKRFKGSYGNVRPKKEKMIERIKDKVEVPRSTPWPLPFKLI
ncbi:hypothetical protein MLD38_023402 [Melastoma candidum]|uniref:Uncharacterized protein n=1 Tax=Melastoma candidum TaxID=119954 RepID=A0ACB9QMJ9_9MYRT|nr:hypothetical protein MLD38_023402 [Melastoma candidum]